MTDERPAPDAGQTDVTPTAAELFEATARAAQRLAFALRHPQSEDILTAWRQLKERMEFDRQGIRFDPRSLSDATAETDRRRR